MTKKQQEAHETDSIPWTSVEGSPGVYEKVLNVDPEIGSVSRLVKFDPGTKTHDLLAHDFYEEFLIIKGSVIDIRNNLEFKTGYYGYRHPGMEHGPYYSPAGLISFEIRNYEK